MERWKVCIDSEDGKAETIAGDLSLSEAERCLCRQINLYEGEVSDEALPYLTEDEEEESA
jgi:hypothetical protein